MNTKELLEKATARPWKVNGYNDCISDNNKVVFEAPHNKDHSNWEQDKELCLKAVNNFEPMLEALKAVLEMGDEYEAEKLVREAIKQAEGEA